MNVSQKRGDIQGLRAIAVLAVILYHSQKIVPGGFLGVDIFFVISGFVIAKSIYQKWEINGRLNLIDFYVARTKRLLPALSLVIIFFSLVIFFLYSPLGMQQNATKTAIGALTLSANFVIFNLSNDYFALSSSSNPFLHTWSLAVEEQFYLVFPALFIIVGIIRKKFVRELFLILIVIIITIASLGMMLLSSDSNWITSFYSPITRAWEFGFGVLAYLVPKLYHGRQLNIEFLTFISTISFSIMIMCIFFLSELSSFPSIKLVIPVIATSIILMTPPNRLVYGFLNSEILQRIGDRSYSLYLWHWPSLVTFAYLFPESVFGVVIALILTALGAELSYAYVENPLRYFKGLNLRFMTKFLSAFLVIPILVAGTVGFSAKIYFFPKFESGEVAGYYEGDIGAINFESFTRQNTAECRNKSEKFELSGCDADVAFLGDSHSEHLVPGFSSNFPALIPISIGNEVFKTPMSVSAKKSILDLLTNPFIKIVVINKYWSNSGIPKNLSNLVDQIVESKKSVVLLDGTPNFPFDAFTCKYGKSFFLRDSQCEMSTDRYLRDLRVYQFQLKKLAGTRKDVYFFESSKLFCNSIRCSMLQDKKLHYLDLNHLNVNGSKHLTRELVEREPIFCDVFSLKISSTCSMLTSEALLE
jgi:peptidoglycan/LPS O-acetylase OafA/YrhL